MINVEASVTELVELPIKSPPPLPPITVPSAVFPEIVEPLMVNVLALPSLPTTMPPPSVAAWLLVIIEPVIDKVPEPWL